MNYVDSLEIFGVSSKEIPSIRGSGAPTKATEGAVGCLYMDTDNGNMHKCIAASDGVYTWVDIAPTDAHINELINTALGVIENGTY